MKSRLADMNLPQLKICYFEDNKDFEDYVLAAARFAPKAAAAITRLNQERMF
jgi:hypothetical protein